MQIDYELTIDDLRAAHRHFARTSPFVRRKYWQSYWAAFILGAGVWFVLNQFRIGIGFILFVAGYGVCVYFVHELIYWNSLDRNITALFKEHPQPGVLGKHTIRIDPDGITEKTEVNDSHHLWQSVDRIDQDNRQIYLFMGVAFLSIPKNAFMNDFDADEFFVTAKDYREKAQQKSV
jgi:hypothetical protein